LGAVKPAAKKEAAAAAASKPTAVPAKAQDGSAAAPESNFLLYAAVAVAVVAIGMSVFRK
jgi:hypothetical protein